MTKVIIDGVEYAPVQEAVQKKAILWRANIEDRYYSVDDCRYVISPLEAGDEADDYRYLTGNYYETKEQAEKALAYSLALGRVTHAILKANDGWEADWKNDEQYKWYIFYNHNVVYKLKVENACFHQSLLKLPYITSREIAEQILQDHKEDLEIIFEV